MAVISKPLSNDLAEKKKKNLIYSGLSLVPTGFAMLFTSVIENTTSLEFLIVITFISFLSTLFFLRRVTIYSAGLKGEIATLEVLQKLSDDYHILSGIKLSNEGKQTEIDHLVLGPNGVFVLETKNHKGFIKGDANAQKWVQQKTGRKGGQYAKSMGNPIKQTKRQIWILSSNLKQENIRSWVSGVIYFPNSRCKVTISNVSDLPVFDREADLLKYIQNYHSKSTLTVANIAQIKSFILQNKQESILAVAK